MNQANRIGWMIQIECTCEAGVIHLVSEYEIMDMSGELPGTVTCNKCGKPLLAIGDDNKVYSIGERLL